ncbi:MAG: hypothetical protein QXK06_02710 [Candidatus Diapherotrites archaeon]
MDLNPVNLLFFPGKTVKKAIEKPSFNTALFLVLSPSIITVLAFLAVSLEIDWIWLASYTLKNYLGWMLFSSAVYFFAFLAIGKQMKGTFSAIYSSLSFCWLIFALMVLLGFIASIAFAPKLLGLARIARDAKLDAVETALFSDLVANRDQTGLEEFLKERGIKTDASTLLPAEGEEILGGPGMLLVAAIALVLLVYALIVFPFLAVKQTTKSGFLKSTVIYLCSIAIMLFFSMVFSAL